MHTHGTWYLLTFQCNLCRYILAMFLYTCLVNGDAGPASVYPQVRFVKLVKCEAKSGGVVKSLWLSHSDAISKWWVSSSI